MSKKTVALVIMDGYGFGEDYEGNAVKRANTPNLDKLLAERPNASLVAAGEGVGLPDGQMGNSEVGHLNFGAGRVVYQSLTKINIVNRNNEFNTIENLANAVKVVKERGSKLHILGLLSDGGVHSHIDHIEGLLKMAKAEGVENIYTHAFLDGRDVAPKSAQEFIDRIESLNIGSIATISGRYYSMDRDNNWDRTELAFDAMVNGNGLKAVNATEALNASYAKDELDEFVAPTVCDESGLINDNDVVIFANFRPDRAIQIATALTNKEATGVKVNGVSNLEFVCMMTYSDAVKGKIAFGLEKLENTYGEVIAANGMKQLRIAETEKYAHVTFFFDGGVDKEIEGSKRVLVNSPKVATYDLQPEMSIYEVCEKAVAEIKSQEHDTIILNFANCDMVGHTGSIDATIKAVEATDECIGKVVEALDSVGGIGLITADHGNAEKLLDEAGKPFTAHTANLVPLICTDSSLKVEDGKLGDVAPTMLTLLRLEVPKEMTGNIIVK